MKPDRRQQAARYAHLHYSQRYHTLQRLDPVTGVKRNLRPLQVALQISQK